MKVLFLGAGASKGAGYPLASELLAEVGMYVESSRMSGVRDEWARYLDFWKATRGVSRRILESTNPEVVLTLLDLFAEARATESQDFSSWLSRFGKTWDKSDRRNLKKARKRREKEPHEFAKVELARLGLRRALDKYFWQKHAGDAEETARARRSYLERELSDLAEGDVVITTNWDSLVERVLLETRRLTPADGFGFPVSLTVEPAASPLAVHVPRVSDVKVLKLHGSFGWYKRYGGIYLGENHYFRYLFLNKDNSVLFFKDTSEPDLDPYPEAAFIYPSFIKQFVEPELRRVWAEASWALAKCAEFRAVGYSLPESDVGVRTLLNPLSLRIRERAVSVIVEDPAGAVNKRWQALLGDDIILTGRSIGATTPESGC